MAKLAFSAQAMAKREVTVEKSVIESRHEMEKPCDLIHGFDVERAVG